MQEVTRASRVALWFVKRDVNADSSCEMHPGLSFLARNHFHVRKVFKTGGLSLFYRGRANLKTKIQARNPSAALAEGKQTCGLASEQADECEYFIKTIIHLFGSAPPVLRVP